MIYPYYPQDVAHVKILSGMPFFVKRFHFYEVTFLVFSFMDHVLDIMHIYFKPRTRRASEFCML